MLLSEIIEANGRLQQNKKGVIMEYLSNRPESTAFSHFITLFLLLFALLRSFGVHANIRQELRYPKERQPLVYLDRTPFNEKNWWIDTDNENKRIICSQRVGVFSEFYEQSPIECTLGRKISDIEKIVLEHVNKHAECISDGQVILCQNPDGTVLKYDVDTNHNHMKTKRKKTE